MLHHTDCLELLSTMDDNSVDLVLTDPPYFIGFDGGKGWDSQWIDEIDYLQWCEQWTNECVRVLKPNRMLVVFGTLKTETFLRYKLETTSTHSNTLTHRMRSFGVTTGVEEVRVTLPVNMSMLGVGQREMISYSMLMLCE